MAAASSGFDLGELEDNNLPTTKPHKTRATTKVTTAKEKRQATLAAAEENAAKLVAGVEGDDDSEGVDDEFGANNDQEHVPLRRPFNAPYFRITSDDDEDNNGDDSNEESPEAAFRPRLSAKRSIEYDESENSEDDGAAGLENHDSDEDDPANSPTRHASRKGKSAGVKFMGATTTTITSKLPVKKIPATQKKVRQDIDISSEGVRSPVRTGTAALSSSPQSRTTSPPKTPRKPVTNASRPRMGDQTPSTHGLLKASASDTRQDLFLTDAFPERVIFTEKCKATFLAACADAQASVQRQRFLKSTTYRGLVLTILRQKLSQIRQDVRNAALAKTAIHYGITSALEPADIITLVDRLKTKLTYVFGDVDRYKQPYGNPIFQILINTLFFEGKRKSDAITNPAPWNPMPLPVIALMATAIHSVLDDWSTGKNEAAKSKFSHDKYAPIYRDHLANLNKFKQRAPAALSRLQISLWENAWSSSGSALPSEANVYIEDDVFAEAEAEALA